MRHACRPVKVERDNPVAFDAVSDYSAPLVDMRFVLHHVVDIAGLSELPGCEHADPATVAGVLEEAARFFSEQFAPLNRVGDVQHSRRNPDGTVTTPAGFDKAYRRYVEAGWAAVPFPPEFGGGGFPWIVGIVMQEMMTAANMAFSLCPLLNHGAIDMLVHYGDEQQREMYLPKLVSGEWTGTMNLTEPQAGSDVGAVTTRAVPAGDGTWRITGQKIFITFGEHDLADNIIHLVLARVPDAPPGTKGISCFIVPKFLRRRRRHPRRAQLGRVRVDRDEDGHQRQSDLRHGVRRRRRLPRRRAQRGHALHVQDDEHGAPLRRRAGPGGR